MCEKKAFEQMQKKKLDEMIDDVNPFVELIFEQAFEQGIGKEREIERIRLDQELELEKRRIEAILVFYETMRQKVDKELELDYIMQE